MIEAACMAIRGAHAMEQGRKRANDLKIRRSRAFKLPDSIQRWSEFLIPKVGDGDPEVPQRKPDIGARGCRSPLPHLLEAAG